MPGPFPKAAVFDPFLLKVVAGIAATLLSLCGLAVIDVALHPCCFCQSARNLHARMVRSAAASWQLAENDYRTCPSLALLVLARHLDPIDAVREDTIAIFCQEDEVMVRWAGPDETFGTMDDASAPD
jgi:hypothetical protein